MYKRILYSLALVAFVAGCSSSPDLAKTDSGTSTATDTGAATNVTPVAADNSSENAAGPAGVERTVYFDFNRYDVKPEYQSLIDSHGKFLKTNARRHIRIEGNTDERGSAEYNLALGQRRSDAVRRGLSLLGVSDSQVEAVSYGKERPAVEGTGEAVWAKNRRADIVYLP
ncbi:MAG: peptidoglycan-associated lipoprotein Pal [Burkholderiaceae bacterium]|jgi:peptidoglycan-associated lipoprotein|nr:peptidoglycan-associated lipoprotein Pal [Burkholderiaceae bacterium]